MTGGMACRPAAGPSTDPSARRSPRRLGGRQVESKGALLVLFIGDDWAEARHDIEIQDDIGRRLVRRRLPEGMAGITVLRFRAP